MPRQHSQAHKATIDARALGEATWRGTPSAVFVPGPGGGALVDVAVTPPPPDLAAAMLQQQQALPVAVIEQQGMGAFRPLPAVQTAAMQQQQAALMAHAQQQALAATTRARQGPAQP